MNNKGLLLGLSLVVFLVSTTILVEGSTTSCTPGEVCLASGANSFVEFSVTSTSRIVYSSGCPPYDWTSQTTPNTATTQCASRSVPLAPILCNEVADVGIYNTSSGLKYASSIPVRGPIGVAINGVQLNGNSDANGNDAYINEGSSFDTCGGHPDQSGVYHYHADPKPGCVYSNIAGQHSPLWGFMADGIPIFGAYGDNGVVPTDLDVCGGHVDESYPYYHYHSTYNYKYPYLVACLHGKTSTSSFMITTATTCTPSSTQYDYSSLINYGISSSSPSSPTPSPTPTATFGCTRHVVRRSNRLAKTNRYKAKVVCRRMSCVWSSSTKTCSM